MRSPLRAGLILVGLLGFSSCTEKPTSVFFPARPDTLVSFASDLQPIFNSRCLSCHGSSRQSNYNVQSYTSIFGPGNEAAARGMLEVRAGKPDSSYLVWKLEGNPPWPISGERMPRSGPYLDSSDIATLRTWIRQGALNN